AMIQQRQQNGFDDLTFSSKGSVVLPESMALNVGRKLTLDAPAIAGSNNSTVSLSAPWLVIRDTSLPAAQLAAASQPAANSKLNLSGEWLDITGGVQAYGFSDITLKAEREMRLSDYNYNTITSGNPYVGSFYTPGNLTIQAGVVYPTTQSVFTLWADKKVAILPGNEPSSGPVYSAGGSLTVVGGAGIDQEGVVKAPLGRIRLVGGTLKSDGTAQGNARVYLGDGSVTSTAGEGRTLLGGMDATTLLYTYSPHDATRSTLQVSSAPAKSVDLDGSEVIVRDKATMDISGGGSVFSYAFQPGLAGTVNPFQAGGRLVIMADNSVQMPDHGAIYIAGGGGLKAGVYSILPEEFAFLPGAMVLTPTGGSVALGQQLLSQDGYAVVGGYKTAMGTDIRSAQFQGYTVRSAADVMSEGHFETKSFIAGDAGTLTVQAATTVLGGTIKAAAIAGKNADGTDFKGGTLSLSGEQVIVQSDAAALTDGFDFSAAFPDKSDLIGKLIVPEKTLNGNGLAEVDLGNGALTKSVLIKSGSMVDVPVISLSAADTISIESNASLHGAGSISLSSPSGSISIAENAVVEAGANLSIEAKNTALNGTIKTDKGSSSLTSDQVHVVSDAAKCDGSGICITNDLWNSLIGGGSLTLTGRSGVTFDGDMTLAGGNSVTIDTPLLAGAGQSGAGLKISSAAINLLNSGKNTGASSLPAAGTVEFAAGNITLGGSSYQDNSGNVNGVMKLAGFSSITLNSSGDLTLVGRGAFSAGWAAAAAGQQLVMTGARLVTAPYTDASGTYQRADFTIDGSHGAVSFAKSAGSAGSSTWAGGTVRIAGDSISVAGIIDVPAGEVYLTAAGADPADGIHLTADAQILSKGVLAPTAETGKNASFDGGTVSLAAASGPVQVDEGATIDVSAADQGDAGVISLAAANGGVTLKGSLVGKANAAGRGGSLLLDSASVDLTALSAILQSGGFTEEINIRARTGDLKLGGAKLESQPAMSGRDITLTADSGAIDLYGTINADGNVVDVNGGRVELNAGAGLTLEASASISAKGTGSGASGGTVLLSSADGAFTDIKNAKVFNGNYALQVKSGAKINVSGTADASGVTHGGTVAFRAYQGYSKTGDNVLNDVNIDVIPDKTSTGALTITGASRVTVEAARGYSGSDADSIISTGISDATTFMNNATAINIIKTRLNAVANNIHLLAGVEIQSSDSLSLDSPWDLTWARPGGEPGVLTLRAGGSLSINANLTDQPTQLTDYSGNVLEKSTAQPSWGFNLVAGADLSSADLMAVQEGSGKDLKIADGVRVYTEKAPIRFAAGNNMTVGDAAYNFSGDSPMISADIPFSIGTYDGEIRGHVNNDLTLHGGVIQSATGAIDIRTGGDLALASPNDTLIGSIRTTGEYAHGGTPNDWGFPDGYLDFWNYQGGGGIRLVVGGNLRSPLNYPDATHFTPGWDMAITGADGVVHWSASYQDMFISLDQNDSYSGVTTQGVATMGGGSVAVRSGGDVTGQFGAFGPGDLRISAAGDLSGRFLVKEGATVLNAGGSLAPIGAAGSLFDAFHDDIRVAAQGNITLGTVVNPTVTSGKFAAPDTTNFLMPN
ncbi:MAG TPA: hypothetical protein VF795_07800, partial [Desulfuromonadaceae bacterium]